MSPDSMRVAVAKAMGFEVWKGVKGRVIGNWAKKDGVSIPLPDFLNDIRDALTFVEFLRGKGFTFTISNGLDGHFEVSVYRGDDCVVYVDNKSLPHAISEAGLKALGLYDGTEAGR